MKIHVGENRKWVYGIYTVSFLCLAAIIVFFHAIHGKSFIHVVDIWDQEYPVYLYLGRQIRQLICSGELHFYDFSIGLGADVIALLNHNGLGDPLNLLSVFAVGKAAPHVYAMTLFLRMYLAGIGMLMYCRRHEKEWKLCVLAGLSYAFSLFALTYGLQFYQTMNAAYLFPFLLMQLETLIRQKNYRVSSGVKFALLITVQACCSYYMLYMQTLMLFVYAVVDFFTTYPGNWRLFWKKVFSVCMYYLLGIMVSAIVLLPVVAGFLTSARAAAGIGGRMRLLWTADEFIPMVADLFVPMLTSWDEASLGISVISLLAFFTCCFSQKPKERILAVLLGFSYICPIVWSIFNGFSYPVHRWIYVIHFAIAYSTILFIERVFEKIEGGGQSKWIEITGALLFLMSMCMHFYIERDKIRTCCYTGIAFLGFCFLRTNKVARVRALTMLCAGNLLINIIFLTAPYQICGQDMWRSFHSLAEVEEITPETDLCMSESAEGEWYRIDCKGRTRGENIIQNYKGCGAYFSAMNKNIWFFYDTMQISPAIGGAVHILTGLDERIVLQSLLSVKYFDNTETRINRYMLPFGFEYTKTISADEFYQMTPLERQDIMLNRIVLEDILEGLGETDRDRSEILELPVTIQYKNVEMTGNKIVPMEDAEILIQFSDELPSEEEAELYISFKGLQGYHFSGNKNVLVGDKELCINSSDLENVYSTGQSDYLVKADIDGQAVTVKLPQGYTYTLDDIQAYLYPLGRLDEAVTDLKEHSFRNLQYGGDVIEGDISAVDGWLFLSIPYDKSWKVYVDGTQTPTQKANVGFTAVELTEGEHHVRIVYDPIPEKAGFIVTILGIAILGGLLIWDRRQYHLR